MRFCRSFILSITLSFLMAACTVPTSSLTTLSVTGQLKDVDGNPLADRPVEVVLPASYGLNEIDLEHGTPQSYGHSEQRAMITTDALGSFAHTFSPVEYSEKFWVLPPLGTIFSSKPTPQFYVRLPETGSAYYSISMDREETFYGVYVNAPGSMARDGASAATVAKPAELKGKLIPDTRDGADGWIANLEFRYVNPQLPRRARVKDSSR